MILAFAAALYGYLHLASCHHAEASYRAAVARRLKLVCGQHRLASGPGGGAEGRDIRRWNVFRLVRREANKAV